jgi:flavorubredoxin
MTKVLVVYATRTGDTKTIAMQIAEGIKASGAEVKVVAVKEITNSSDLQGYDAYVFGSATYHGEMMEAMKTMLFMAEKAKLEGKVGGAFGSYGWSGEAPDRIYQTMKNIFNMKMADNSLRIKSPISAPHTQVAQTYGREICQKIKA